MNRIFGLLLVITTHCGVSNADQRVLFSFDESGHHIRQIFDVANRLPRQNEDVAKRQSAIDSVETALTQMKMGQATLIWLDKQSNWLTTTHTADPRVAHSPGHASGAGASRVGLLTGAWVANGPDEAQRVIVLLPENLSLQLGPEQWPFWLNR